MSIKNRWAIPGDYSETETDWALVTMCIPDTQQWRGIISGLVYTLTRGRYWDETTGVIKVAQALGERVFNSMAITCNDELGRMADALEGINNKVPELYTIQQMLDELGDSPLADIADITDIMTWLQNLFPNLPEIKFSAADVVSLWFNGRRHREIVAEWWMHNLTLKTIAAATGGAVVEEVADDLMDGLLDTLGTLITTAGSVGDLATGVAAIAELYQGGNPTYPFSDPDNAPELRALANATARVTNSISNDINLDICCYNVGDLPLVEAGAGEQADKWTPPEGWGGTLEEYNLYKCQAANLLVDSYIDYLDNALRFLTVGELTNLSMGAFINLVPDIFGAATLVGALPGLYSYLATVILGLYAMAAFIDSYKDNLIADKDAGVCGLYDATNAADARDELENWMSDNLPLDPPDSWVEWHIEKLFTNDVMNVLFEESDLAASYTGGDVVCGDTCGDECDMILIRHSGYPWPGQAVEPVPGEIFTLESVYEWGSHYITFSWNTDCDCRVFRAKILNRSLNGTDKGDANYYACPYPDYSQALPADDIEFDCCFLQVIRGAASSIEIQFIGWL